MFRKKKLLSMILAVGMLAGMSTNAFAQTNMNEYVGATEYIEDHFQINFADLNLQVINEDTLEVDAASNLDEAGLREANEDINTLERIFNEFPEVQENLIKEMQNGELVAVSFTEVPLIEVDGNYERVPMLARGFESSSSNGKGKFLLYTSISGGTKAITGGYKYTAKTQGSWSVNNMLGGSDYPASGDDYVFQASPQAFTRKSDKMSAQYDDYTTGTSGDEFWREDGDAAYVRYGIEDDPLGYRQNKSFTLTTVSAAPKSSSTRLINSYYIHTWKQLTLTASISASSNKSVTLSLTPSITNKSWQVYNYVSFNF